MLVDVIAELATRFSRGELTLDEYLGLVESYCDAAMPAAASTS